MTEEITLIKVAVPVLTLPTTEAALKLEPIEKSFVKFDTDQKAYKTENKKYKQIKEITVDRTTILTHEYVTPSGEVGYQTFIETKLDDGKIMIKSFGRGDEAKDRDFDWREKINEEL